MSKFALKTTLPGYLREWQEKIEKIAHGYGLDFFPTVFEILTYDQMNEVAAYGGFPNRYPHWRYGMEYEQLSKSYEYGLSKIYEMVINNNPAYAYLLEGNSLLEQKLVMAHVLAHVDFFKNNFAFRTTDLDASGRLTDPMRRAEPFNPQRKWIDKMANNGQRVRRHSDRHGVNKVEEFIDYCLSLENLIDPWRPFSPPPRDRDERDEDAAPREVPRLKTTRGYMEKYINPDEYIEEQRRKMAVEAEKEKGFPEHPQRDVLLFLLDHAPLERWERDVLEVIREEAYYFVPQMQTKIMNEGWACLVGNTFVFTDMGVSTMESLVARPGGVVSDGSEQRAVYDRHIIRQHPTVTLKTRRGLTLTGSNNHRVMSADGQTWKRLDELAVGDRLAVSGGQGLWAADEVPVDWKLHERMNLFDVAEEAGVSIDTVLRFRRGAPVERASALAPLLEQFEQQVPSRKLLARRKPINTPATVTRELGTFLGYMVGDGHISRAKHNLGLTTGDHQQAVTFLDLAQQLFGVLASIKRDDNKWRVLVHSESVSDFLVEALGLTFGPSAREKKVPEVILRSPEHVVRDFLRAYFDCDGYAGKQGVILSTASQTMGEQVQLLLLNFGILSRRRLQQDGCWHVHISGKSVETFAAKVGFGLARKKEEVERYLLERRWFKQESWSDEVVSLETGVADVYDISVEETHRYAAGGFINHNSYWHSRIMTEKVADASEILDYADRNASVLSTAKGQLNPYKLGVELYRNIEERWNNGQFGREYEECDDVAAKKNWDLRLGLGRQKVFEVRRLYNDVTFLDEFLTIDVARDLKLFTFAYSSRSERFEIESREFKKIKEKLLFQLTNSGNPVITVIDANHENRGELLLKHDHVGLDLRVDYAKETLKAVHRMWRRPVGVASIVDSKPTLLRYDGVEHTSRPFKH
jgi:stage V sporulation protein R